MIDFFLSLAEPHQMLLVECRAKVHDQTLILQCQSYQQAREATHCIPSLAIGLQAHAASILVMLNDRPFYRCSVETAIRKWNWALFKLKSQLSALNPG